MSSDVLEEVIEDHLVRRAVEVGGRALKLRPPTGRGFPDRTLALPGPWVAFVEVKRPKGGVVAKQQEQWARDLRAAGQRVYLVATKAGVDAIFNDYRKGTENAL